MGSRSRSSWFDGNPRRCGCRRGFVAVELPPLALALETLNDREVTPPHQIAMEYSLEYWVRAVASLVDDERMKTVME